MSHLRLAHKVVVYERIRILKYFDTSVPHKSRVERKTSVSQMVVFPKPNLLIMKAL